MAEKIFTNVWYRSDPVGFRDLTLKAMEDRGTLSVRPGALVFSDGGRSSGSPTFIPSRRSAPAVTSSTDGSS